MNLLKNVHHVRFATKSLWETSKTLIQGLGFTFHCLSKCGPKLNLVLKSNQVVVILSEVHTLSSVHHPSKYHSKLINWCTKHDGPFDIALEVGDVNEVCERVSRFSGFDNILLEPTTYSDHNGRVVLGVIKSCVGDLIHTVIDSSQYKGLFLPGYTLTDSDTSGDLEKMLNKSQENTKSFLKFIDHLAIAGRSGDSAAFINWYNTVFGLERMFINVQEDEAQGFLVKFKNTGMMLKAVCHSNPSSNPHFDACKFVFVEPIKDSEPNQVTRFLQANSGPGLQHIGFATDNITDVATTCCQNGIKFIDAPEAYYKTLSQRINLKHCSVDLEELKKTGVLVDKELDNKGDQIGNIFNYRIPNIKINGEELKHAIQSLLQIFTEPLFEKNGFFIELIERRDQSTGFGENNIKSLWESLEMSHKLK
ncbi:4-hydroxyphenylpyruvate dioxygenase-like protein [Schistosoma japonicum]|nr:4-hydroxyphenylpyruvate dioxygenase-like protein [Schistosoma japonicum]